MFLTRAKYGANTDATALKTMLNSPGVVSWWAVGSRVTCNPAPTDTDEDYLLLVKSIPEFIQAIANFWGYEAGGYLRPNATQEFVSVKQFPINFIISESPEFCNKFLLATYVCTKLNLLHKPDRITVFQAVLYGVEK